MAENNSMLSFISQRHTRDIEDVATDALSFILSRSTSAKQALSEFLADDCGPLPIAKVLPRTEVSHGAVPDLACRDDDGQLVAFIESKFWAQLTHHQPVTYWQGLPVDRSAVLLFLVPDYRLDQGSLWDDLVDRLRNAGHELDTAERDEIGIKAPAKVDQRRLILTSWQLLLERIAQRTEKDGDARACFEIAELQGLAADAIVGGKPTRDENLKGLIADAVKRVEQSDWANTDGLGVGWGDDYYGRYLRLGGASAWLGIDYRAVKQMPGKPLWLTFGYYSDASVDVEAVRSSLGTLAEPGLEWYPGHVCVPIALPVAADGEATLDAMVTELERIAKLIDSNGPTYRKRTPIAGDQRPMARPEPKDSFENRGQGCTAIKVVCWNIATMHEPWRLLVEMDADVALLQEVGTIPEDILDRVELSPHKPWLSHDPATGKPNYDRWPIVVRLSDRVKVEWFRQVGPVWVDPEQPRDMAVSGIGMVEVARVVPTSGAEPFIAASMYARWLDPHPTAAAKSWIYPDASAHSIISDLSAFIGHYDRPDKHRILAAGDLNMSFQSTNEFDHRAQTVLDRFQALGLDYMGPRHPAGRRADPIPEHLNEESLDVPTYYHKPSNTPAGAYVQIDHVFASRGFHKEVQAKALNGVGEWGPSDHCRICIELGDDRYQRVKSM